MMWNRWSPIPLILALFLGVSTAACRPLININAETGRKASDKGKPLCERVISRMIRCSTDPSFRGRLERNRAKAVKACEREGREDAKRCDKKYSCNAFVRCLQD